MTRAAAELGLSQPGVTAQVRSLERQLGTVLFHRTSRGLLPTAAGDELAGRIGRSLDALVVALAGSTGATTDPFARTVLLGGPPELTALRVLPALADLYGRGLRLRVVTDTAETLLRELTGGGLDLVVSTIRPRGRALAGVPLTDEEFVLVGSPVLAGRPEFVGIAADPRAALAAVPLVAYAEDLPIVRRYWRHVFGQAPPAGSPAVIVADLRGVAAACVAGAGYSVLPRYLIGDQLAAGHLAVLHTPDDPPINTFYLVRRTSASPDPAVTAVGDRLLERAPHW